MLPVPKKSFSSVSLSRFMAQTPPARRVQGKSVYSHNVHLTYRAVCSKVSEDTFCGSVFPGRERGVFGGGCAHTYAGNEKHMEEASDDEL